MLKKLTIRCVYICTYATIEPLEKAITRDIVLSRGTFNSRDSNLHRAAAWIVPFREDYVNIYTASEISSDFPTVPIRFGCM